MSEVALDVRTCFAIAERAGLVNLDTWGLQGGPAHRVSGRLQGIPLELIFWSRDYAEQQVDSIFFGGAHATAEALYHGVALRTSGRLEVWQHRLAGYPDELATARIEEAAMPWGGFAAAGLLTLVRPGNRMALMEWNLEGAKGPEWRSVNDTALVSLGRCSAIGPGAKS